MSKQDYEASFLALDHIPRTRSLFCACFPSYRIHALVGLWLLRLTSFFLITVSCPYLLRRGRGLSGVCYASSKMSSSAEHGPRPALLSPFSIPHLP